MMMQALPIVHSLTTTRRPALTQTTAPYSMTGASCGNAKGHLIRHLSTWIGAIRFSFADANICCDRGLAWYEKARHDRAIADFNQAMKLDPNFAPARINRGLILHRNSEFNLAFAKTDQEIRVDPSIVDAIRLTNLHH
jgi:tetratricopeptide (TPR) repeat protein